jgi:excisionase family DNA binding protein
VTVTEAAAYLDVSIDWVLRECRLNKLRAVKVGRVWDVHPVDVENRLIEMAERRAERVGGKG